MENRIARVATNGVLDVTINFGIGANNFVAATAVQGDGKILVGGGFTNFNGTAQNYFARLQGGQNLGAGLMIFRSAAFTVNESATNALITVSRIGGLAGTVTVAPSSPGMMGSTCTAPRSALRQLA